MSKTHVEANVIELHSKFQEFFKEEKYKDITVLVNDGRSFKCHKLALAATSKFFDAKFTEYSRGNDEQPVLVLNNVDGAAFEEVLRYAYTGRVQITDDNLWSLVSACELLKLDRIEESCVRYIEQRTTSLVPKILKVFELACRTQKRFLTIASSRHIMQNFEQVSRDTDFLELSAKHLRVLLSQHWFMPVENEQLLCTVIIRWLFHALEERAECSHECWATIDFHLLSAEYMKVASAQLMFHQSLCNPGSDCVDGPSQYLQERLQQQPEERFPYVCEGPACEFAIRPVLPKFGLHVLVDEDVHKRGGIDNTKIYSTNRSDPKWSTTVMSGSFQCLRTVSLDDRGLFCLTATKTANQFRLCSSVRSVLSTATLEIDKTSEFRRLSSPPIVSGSYDLCHTWNKRRIYMKSNDPDIGAKKAYTFSSSAGVSDRELMQGIYWYNEELDQWFTVPLLRERRWYSTLVSSAATVRVYLVGCTDKGNALRALDSRAPKWLRLADSLHSHASSSCCVYDKKIYACYNNPTADAPVNVEVYDPVAGKWEEIDAMNEISHCIQLVTHDNWMWAFGKIPSKENDFKSYAVETYNSRTRAWSPSPVAGTIDAGVSSFFMDAFAFKPTLEM